MNVGILFPQSNSSELDFEISGLPSPRTRFTAFLLSASPHQTMNSSHGDLLADRLSRLPDLPVQAHPPNDTTLPPPPKTPSYDGYGFRPPSGMSSPLIPPDRNSPLPDVNGLGWPGQFSFLLSHPSSPPPAPAPLTPSSFSKSTSKVDPLSPQRIPRRESVSRNQTRCSGPHRPRMHRRGSRSRRSPSHARTLCPGLDVDDERL